MGKYAMKRKKGVFWYIALSIILLLLVSLIGVSVYVWVKLDKITYADEIEQSYLETIHDYDDSADPAGPEDSSEDVVISIDDLDEFATPPTIPDSDVNSSDHILNILLIGTDERTTRYNSNARADSMILVSINQNLHTVRLVSLERGIGVPILDGDLQGQYDLLTHIFRWGGADLLVKTVEHCF